MRNGISVFSSSRLSPSLEDYLLAIATLLKDQKTVRLRDVVKVMGVSSPSANSAVKILTDRGYIIHDKYEHIDITPSGIAIAEDILNRRQTITDFFKLFTSLDNLYIEKIVCKIEHYLSKCIKDFENLNSFFKNHPQIYQHFKEYVSIQNQNKKEQEDEYNTFIHDSLLLDESDEEDLGLFNGKPVLLLNNAKEGKYQIVGFKGFKIQLRLKQMGIVMNDKIKVLNNQSGQVLIAKDNLRFGLGRGAAMHIYVIKVD
ncbi:MAG: metal-dependent transcriptional regulator [Spirochaetes bacterium]|jgi:DtxR family Mn-dependent transcriptional regulator|nr:metal-dependent transcriptional regulator [Spirochaetota bacterium]NLJ04898.1 metal-dependent transcriptional regulator [Exilispira sp.]MBP8990573.1 metal-dependent transcriptional regulator [Spirochaetota bacterium]HNV44051.1 metal-dependent transcriptional regulator [Exilispira sp.]HOV45745.1 metal-dependent transcriptional regulator [Exilispira sp.]